METDIIFPVYYCCKVTTFILKIQIILVKYYKIILYNIYIRYNNNTYKFIK